MPLSLKMKNKNPLLNMQIQALPNDKFCRICLEREPVGDLITPCWCAGSMSHVHSQCLEEWIKQTSNPQNINQCNVCKFVYIKSKPPQYCFQDLCSIVTRGTLLIGTINMFMFNLFITYMFFGILSLTVGSIDWDIDLFHIAIVCSIFYCLIFVETMYAWFIACSLKCTNIVGGLIAYMAIWGGGSINVWIFARPEIASVFGIGIFPAHFLITTVYSTLLKKAKTKSRVLPIQNIESYPDEHFVGQSQLPPV